MKFTHIGWFGVVPVRIANLDSEAPYLEARWLPDWAVDIQALIFYIIGCLLPGRPMFPIKITGELS